MMSDADNAKQAFEQLKARYDKLNRLKIQAETNLEAARRQLEELKAQAKTEYGTDDIDLLKAKLVEMTSENEQKRAAYQTSLDRIETDLKAVEEKYNDIEKGGAD